MPTYSFFCKSCDEPYEIRMSIEENGTLNARCPKCGAGEDKQEIFGVSPGGGEHGNGGCCGAGRKGCCG